jgi:hypothetical protein
MGYPLAFELWDRIKDREPNRGVLKNAPVGLLSLAWTKIIPLKDDMVKGTGSIQTGFPGHGDMLRSRLALCQEFLSF